MTETFVKERKHNLTGKVEPVKIDDACAFLCRFDNGSLGLFESTRYARGHKALYTFEVNGEKASLKWDLHDLHRLQYFDHGDEGILRGWRSIHVTDGDHPYMKHWWVPGPPDRLRAHLRPPGRRLPPGPRRRQAHQPHLPRGPGHPGRLRRRARLGRGRPSGRRSCRSDRCESGRPERSARNRTSDRGTTHENRHEPAALDRPTSPPSTTRSSTRSRRLGSTPSRSRSSTRATCAPYERLGKRLKALGLGATAVTVMGPETNPISPDPAIRKAAVALPRQGRSTAARRSAARSSAGRSTRPSASSRATGRPRTSSSTASRPCARPPRRPRRAGSGWRSSTSTGSRSTS